jgi:sortase A
MSRRRLAIATAAALLMIGSWELGRGAWIAAKAQVAQVLLQRAWARALEGEARPKPWPWADTWPVARLRATAHGVDLIALAGASGRTLAFGPGHVTGSALPGEPGAAIFTGHRDTHFQFTRGLQPGDRLTVELPRRRPIRYRVLSAQIADSRTARLADDHDGEYLVLVTCYPFDALASGGPLRYVVTAEKTDPTRSEPAAED